MPSLLDLPRELRELIIEQVINGRRTPPSAPCKSNRVDFQDIRYSAWHEKDSQWGIYHEQCSTHCPSNCHPLLLTNHQISAETRSFLDRTKSTRYILDISVLNDLDLFPTWLSVPRITNRISTLSVDVRLFGHIISKKEARNQVGDGGRQGFHWSFYALLERFLRYGPVGEKKGGEPRVSGSYFDNLTYEHRDVTVHSLVLHFQSAERKLSFPPDEVDYSTWGGWHWGDHHFDEDGNKNIMDLEMFTTRPEWLARYLISEIRSLLQMDYHTAAYGKILYEAIGTIRMIVDQELYQEIDLACELSRLRFTNPEYTFGHLYPHEKRLPAFWKWKKETLTRRSQLGFPVVWPQDPELM